MRIFLSVLIAACVALTGCEAPQKKKRRSTKHSHRVHKSKHKPGAHPQVKGDTWIIVNDAWMQEYKWMEREHGDYTIEADDQIHPEGGNWRVPREVIQHRSALVEAGP